MLEQQLLSEKVADEQKRGTHMPEISTQPLRLNINRAVKRGIICSFSETPTPAKIYQGMFTKRGVGAAGSFSYRRPRYRFKILRPWFVANRMLCTHDISGRMLYGQIRLSAGNPSIHGSKRAAHGLSRCTSPGGRRFIDKLGN